MQHPPSSSPAPLFPARNGAAAQTILLASGSPRRASLLRATGRAVEVVRPGIEETWPGGPVGAATEALALAKLRAVQHGDGVWVAADTVVWIDDVPLGKPTDAEHARATLQRLKGRPHQVVTGFVVARGAERRCAHVVTQVCLRPLTAAEIDAYVDGGECFDKAGAYAIQGGGGSLLDWIHGSYTNVVGLPLLEVVQHLDALGA